MNYPPPWPSSTAPSCAWPAGPTAEPSAPAWPSGPALPGWPWPLLAAMAHGHTPEAFLGIATALLITAAPLVLTILPGWIAWITTDRRSVTITDPHAVSVRTWDLDAPAASVLENTLAEHLHQHAPAQWTAPADLHRITEPWAPLR